MSKVDIILNMLQNVLNISEEQMRRQVELEEQVRELMQQNQKLQLNLMAMNPVYSDEDRREAMMKLTIITKEEERTKK